MNKFRHLPRKLLWVALISLLLAVGYRTLTLERRLANASAHLMHADTELETKQDMYGSSFDEALVALRQGLGRVSDDVTTIDLEVDEVKLVVAEQAALIVETQRRLAAIENRASEVMLRLLQVDDGLALLEDEFDEGERRREAEATELHKIARTVGGMQGELSELRSKEPSGDVLARIALVEETLAGQDQAINELVQKRFAEHFKETKDELIFIATQKPSGRPTN